MEIYRTGDGKVTKYVHDDGSETSIKHARPEDLGGGDFGKVTNKFNVFISSSVGCPMKCKFCYLTVKKFPFHNLDRYDITKNVIDAIIDQVNTFPELKEKYVKLSWMGMGDPCIDFTKTIDATDMIIRAVMEQELCKGVDGIDVGTCLPKSIKKDTILYLLELFNGLMSDFPRNPLRTSISPWRIFYSLHSSLNETRSKMIPNSLEIADAFHELSSIPPKQAKIIVHHMFLENVNDSDREVENLIKLMNYYKAKDYQLRILRYNTCDHSPCTESPRFREIIKKVYRKKRDLKIQASPGSEVKAACGQFLLSKMDDCDECS